VAKAAYIGVGNVARKVKKMYIGVGGVARKVKKAYIGVGGLARLCWSANPPILSKYTGTVTPLSLARTNITGASIGIYALFAGGYYYSINGTVDSYNSFLVKGNPASVTARQHIAADSHAICALFAGGSGSPNPVNTVEAYDANLTKTTLANLAFPKVSMGCAGLPNVVFFAGGNYYDPGTGMHDYQNSVDTYFSDNVKGTMLYLDSARGGIAGCSVGNKVLFAGGENANVGGGRYNHVDAFDSNLVHYTPTYLYAQKYMPVAEKVGDYIVITGGQGVSGTLPEVVDVYNSSLVKLTNLSGYGRYGHAAASVEGYAIFAGGAAGSARLAYVEAFDENLVRSYPDVLSVGRSALGGAKAGSFAIFAGGGGSGGDRYYTVDAYQSIS